MVAKVIFHRVDCIQSPVVSVRVIQTFSQLESQVLFELILLLLISQLLLQSCILLGYLLDLIDEHVDIRLVVLLDLFNEVVVVYLDLPQLLANLWMETVDDAVKAL